MSKAILVLDEMPKDCKCCPIHFLDIYNNDSQRWWCGGTLKTLEITVRPNWCPLREVPERQVRDYPGYDRYITGYDDGWDDCLNEILGE